MKTYLKPQIALVLAILLMAYLWTHPNPSSNFTLPLQAPAVKAQSSSFLEREAGISVYVKANKTINISQLRDVFRTVEMQTNDFIIGSISLTNYDEGEDVHAYAHKDGWLLTYYLANDPIGKIIDWRAYNNTTIPTKLEQALGILANRVGVGTTNATFYDFRFPTATHLMLAGKSNGSFQIKLPDGFEYYQSGWAFAQDAKNVPCCGGSEVIYQIDGVKLNSLRMDYPENTKWQATYGALTIGQLLPNVYHTITAENDKYSTAYAGVVIIYKSQ